MGTKKRKRLKLWFGILLLLSAFISYKACDLSYHNFFPRPALPAPYKAYRLPADTPLSPHYRLELLTAGDLRGSYYDSVSHSLIVIAGHDLELPDGNTNYIITYYRIDTRGRLIDSLAYDGHILHYLNGYLVQQDGYLDWPMTGDTSLHLFRELAGDPGTLLKQQYNRARMLQLFSDYDIYSDDPADKGIDRIALFLDSSWYVLRGPDLVNYDVYPPKYHTQQAPLSSTSPERSSLRDEVQQWADPKRPMYIAYFHKTQFLNGHGPAFMSPTGTSTPDRWAGFAYLNLRIGSDTLKIKEPLLELVEDDPWYYYRNLAHSELSYYTHPDLDFGLFSDDGYHLYIARPR